jgi:phosphate transport system permease protein
VKLLCFVRADPVKAGKIKQSGNELTKLGATSTIMQSLSDFPFGLIAIVIVLSLGAFAWRNSDARARVIGNAGQGRLHSLPGYHGWYSALLVTLPALALIVLQGLLASDTVSMIAFTIGALALSGLGFFLARSQLGRDFRARNKVELIVQGFMMLASGIAILTTLGIVLSLLFETIKFFGNYSAIDFLFGTQWSPQVAIRADQVGQSGAFGAVPLFVGTFLIMIIAMIVAIPVGLGSAIYLSEYASKRSRTIIKPILELLAGIPTVVFGFFALLTVAPLMRAFGSLIGLDVSAQSALAAGLVMGIMIIPFISSLSDDVINAVPQSLRDGSFAMGATKSETIAKVIIPAALPGIVGSVLLAVSKALGETMIVTMAAGQNANLTLNPLEMVTTVTVQIVTLLTGDQEYDSPKTRAAFALGFVLFFVTLILNIIALRVVQKYREKYD